MLSKHVPFPGVGEPVTNQPANHAKRLATYLPIIGVMNDGAQISLKPVLIFKGGGRISNTEMALHDPRVHIMFQESGVTDGPTMMQILQKWFPAHGPPILLVLDSARQHWTPDVKAEMKARNLIPVRVPEGMTSFIQFLDVFWFFRFKSNYRRQYALATHGAKKMNLSEQRVAMSLLVAEAHHQTLKHVVFHVTNSNNQLEKDMPSLTSNQLCFRNFVILVTFPFNQHLKFAHLPCQISNLQKKIL